jgi:hypothetical protein
MVTENFPGGRVFDARFLPKWARFRLALTSRRVPDPNHGDAAALQHPSTDRREIWADIFANYVAGNINLDKSQGRDMYNFVTGALALYVSALFQPTGSYR